MTARQTATIRRDISALLECWVLITVLYHTSFKGKVGIKVYFSVFLIVISSGVAWGGAEGLQPHPRSQAG